MTIKLKNEGRIFYYEDPSNKNRVAEIIFIKKTDISKWELLKCDTGIISKSATKEDWAFIKGIATKIEDLTISLNSEEVKVLLVKLNKIVK